MRTVRTFVVVPSLPEKLARLKEIAHNLWWSWNYDAVDLFRRLDSELWEQCGHNPVKMLGQLSQERIDSATEDAGLLAHLDRICKKMDSYLSGSGLDGELKKNKKDDIIAYFSAEFGINESLPIYSGGLGILAGDHLKSASDLGLNPVGNRNLILKTTFTICRLN